MSKKRLLFSLNVSLQKTGARKGCSLLLTKLQEIYKLSLFVKNRLILYRSVFKDGLDVHLKIETFFDLQVGYAVKS